MATDVIMPRMGDMEEGTLLRWLIEDGQAVSKGQPLLVIQTEKANLEIEAPASGTLTILVQAGETVPMGTVVARIA